ncbi:MAG: hypothetical protein ACKV2O_21345 [Acidimicrobiales bacterium]
MSVVVDIVRQVVLDVFDGGHGCTVRRSVGSHLELVRYRCLDGAD